MVHRLVVDVPGTNVPVTRHTFPETRWVSRAICGSRPARRAVALGPGDRLDLPRTCRIRSKCSD